MSRGLGDVYKRQTSELGYIIQDEGMPEDTKCIYYCIEGKDSKTNDTVKKYFKLEL